MPKIFLCFSPITLSYFLQYIIHYSSSSWPALYSFFNLEIILSPHVFPSTSSLSPCLSQRIKSSTIPSHSTLYCISRCLHFSPPLHKHTALTVFPTSVSFIQYLFLSLGRYICSKYVLLSFKQVSQLPNWRHPSFCCDPRKDTVDRGEVMIWIQYILLQTNHMLCHKKTLC